MILEQILELQFRIDFVAVKPLDVVDETAVLVDRVHLRHAKVGGEVQLCRFTLVNENSFMRWGRVADRCVLHPLDERDIALRQNHRQSVVMPARSTQVPHGAALRVDFPLCQGNRLSLFGAIDHDESERQIPVRRAGQTNRRQLCSIARLAVVGFFLSSRIGACVWRILARLGGELVLVRAVRRSGIGDAGVVLNAGIVVLVAPRVHCQCGAQRKEQQQLIAQSRSRFPKILFHTRLSFNDHRVCVTQCKQNYLHASHNGMRLVYQTKMNAD